jgi:hypothetical protein
LSIRSSSTSVVSEAVVEFLKSVPPFQFLPLGELPRLVPSMTLDYFPKDATIIKAGHRASEVLAGAGSLLPRPYGDSPTTTATTITLHMSLRIFASPRLPACLRGLRPLLVGSALRVHVLFDRKADAGKRYPRYPTATRKG